MNALIALGILALLLLAFGVLIGWDKLISHLSDRFNWPLWLSGCITFAPFTVGIYFVILLKLNS